jgi:hypothetical protein
LAGRFSLNIQEVSALIVHIRNYEQIPDVVSKAAAEAPGREPDDFIVDIRV